MENNLKNEVEIQREYYAKTAEKYDEMHLDEQDEHYFALSFLVGMVDYCNISSILDVGAGTGRAVAYIKNQKPEIKVLGVEPVRELREAGFKKGLSSFDLVDGDATCLNFEDGSFDFVCEFGVLHHLPEPSKAVKEMLRVAKKGIFISDCNNFGQGSYIMRSFKQLMNTFGLWNTVNSIKTKGKGYMISDGDGLSYSYSVFNDYKFIKENSKSVHIINTLNAGIDPYRSATHVALLALKK